MNCTTVVVCYNGHWFQWSTKLCGIRVLSPSLTHQFQPPHPTPSDIPPARSEKYKGVGGYKAGEVGDPVKETTIGILVEGGGRRHGQIPVGGGGGGNLETTKDQKVVSSNPAQD